VNALYQFKASAAACFLVITPVAQSTPGTVSAYSNRAIPLEIGKNAKDITWSGADALLVATELGIYRMPIAAGLPAEIIKGISVPDGLPEPTALSSDGKVVSAISFYTFSRYALRLADRKRLVAQRGISLIPMDIAVFGSRSCVLGFVPNPALEAQKDVAVWCGGPSDFWTELKPIHYLHNEHARDLFRESPGELGGRIAVEPDGTVDVITSVQPGVFRYGGDGKLREILGQSIDDLVLESIKEIKTKFASDLENRYRLLLNAQPIIDDLVVTPAGPAILVRLADKDKIHWELWYPLRSGGVGERIRLGIDRIGPYGHLRCDVRGSDMACAGSQPPRSEASVTKTAQAWPHLWLFHLPSKPVAARKPVTASR
jgi:hypothetical protein